MKEIKQTYMIELFIWEFPEVRNVFMLDLLFNYKLTTIKTSTQSLVRLTSGLFRNTDNYDMMCAE